MVENMRFQNVKISKYFDILKYFLTWTEIINICNQELHRMVQKKV